MVLVVLSVGWLLVAGVLSTLAAIKLHAPGMLADSAWLTYGRLQPAAWNAFVFGFASLAGLALALWMTARLGRTRLVGAGAIILGALVWNVGLKLGLLGILAGESTGIEGLEIPRFASPILLLGYLCMAAWVPITFGRRQPGEVYISQWYLLGAVFSFPWFFAAGHIMTVFLPLRGVLQIAAQAWFLQNLLVLWFGFLGLAAIFYLLPKLTGVAVPSRNLALFGFWTLAAFGGLGGLTRYAGGPFPAWMLSLAVVANVLTAFPVYAVGQNLLPVLRGRGGALKSNVALRFAAFAFLAYLVAGGLGALNSLASVRYTTQFTLVTVGLDQLALMGFFGMAALGALYFVVPRLLARDWPRPALANLHFVFAAAAVAVIAVAFLGGGLAQGAALNDPELPFINVVKRYLPFASSGTLAQLLFLAGTGLFALNLLLALIACCRAACVPAAKALMAPLPVEVKA